MIKQEKKAMNAKHKIQIEAISGGKWEEGGGEEQI